MSPPISSSGGYNLTHQGIYPIWTSLGTLDASSASGGPISAALNADEDGPDGEGGGGGGGGGGLISELEERLKSMSIRAGSTGRGSRSASASVSRRGSGTHTPRERKVSERTPHPRAHPHAHAHAHANTSHHSGHSASTYPQGPPSYLPAISHLLASRQSFPDKSIHPSELRPSISSSSEKVELRKLILTICGESKEGGKGDVEEMLRRGERSKAAFRAFFRGDESGTVGILMSSEGTSPIGAPPPPVSWGKDWSMLMERQIRMIRYSARRSQASCPNQRLPEDPNTSTPIGPTLFAGWTTHTSARSFLVLRVKIGKVSWKKSIYRCWREWSSECSILMIGRYVCFFLPHVLLFIPCTPH